MGSISRSGKSPGGGNGNPLQYSWGFPCGSAVKYPLAIQEIWVDPWVGKIPREGKGHPLQYSGRENSMDCIVHRVTKSQTGLNDFHFPRNLQKHLQPVRVMKYYLPLVIAFSNQSCKDKNSFSLPAGSIILLKQLCSLVGFAFTNTCILSPSWNTFQLLLKSMSSELEFSDP